MTLDQQLAMSPEDMHHDVLLQIEAI